MKAAVWYILLVKEVAQFLDGILQIAKDDPPSFSNVPQ